MPENPMPETVTFNATSLLSKWGFNDGDCPDLVMNDLYDGRGLPPEEAQDFIDAWQTELLIPLVRRVLVPALPHKIDLSVYEDGNHHNPIRVERIDGVWIDTYKGAPDKYTQAFDPHRLTLPVRYITDVILGLDTLSTIEHLPLPVLAAAATAGLSMREAKTLHDSGDLTVDTLANLDVLAALRN